MPFLKISSAMKSSCFERRRKHDGPLLVRRFLSGKGGAGMAETLEDSSHMSVAERMAELKPERKTQHVIAPDRLPAAQ